jgi:3-oxoacyl-(acyl-carrier-protein) synthase
MSASASDLFRKWSGAFVLEDLETALSRGVRIYAEVLGGNINSGGQRGLGTMTAPNPIAVQRCITSAMASAGIQAVDTINGHLTVKRQFRNRKLGEL